MRNSYTFKTFFFPFCYLQIFLPSNCSSRFLFHKAAACFFCVTSLSVKFLRWLSFNSAIHKICLKSISVICSGITSYKWRAVNVPRCQGVIFTFPLNARRLEIFQKKKKWQQKSSLCSVYVSLKSLWCNLNMILPPSPDKEFAQICLMCAVEQKMDRNLHLCVYVCLCVSVRTSSCAPLRHLISFVRLQQLFFFFYTKQILRTPSQLNAVVPLKVVSWGKCQRFLSIVLKANLNAAHITASSREARIERCFSWIMWRESIDALQAAQSGDKVKNQICIFSVRLRLDFGDRTGSGGAGN